MTQKTKICTKCKKELPATLEYFYRSVKTYKETLYNNGLRYWCKNCFKEQKRERRTKIREKINEYRKKNWEKFKFLNHVHYKVRSLKSKQKYCSICNEEKKLELSSIDGIYTENPKDYWWLCHECHHLYDRINKTHKRLEKV